MPKKGQRGARRPLGAEGDSQGFAALAESYLESLRVRNYSPATIASREHHLREFIRWAEERGLARPAEVTKPTLERYQRFLYHYRKKDGQPLSFRSQHGCLVPVRAFFKWLCRQNHLLANPAADLELPRAEKRLPRHVLTAAEAEHVLGLPDVAQPLGLRDRAILEALYSTGMRRMELIGLKLYDLDQERGTIFIRQGKGKKDRMVPMGERAFAWVRRYLEEARPSLALTPDDGLDRLQRFDVVLANPPYSIKQWDRDAFASDPWGRNLYGTPPQGRADYAFQQHILQSLKPKTGRCAVLWPHGVLFRQEEAEMRRKLIEADLIECVVGLGPNLFYNSAMDSCVVVCRTNKPKNRRGKILLIDAKEEVSRERTQSFLTPDHLARILQAYQGFSSEPSFSRIVTLAEVRANDGNLNIALYIDSTPKNRRGGSTGNDSLGEAFRGFALSAVTVRKAFASLSPEALPRGGTSDSPVPKVRLPEWVDKSKWKRVRLGDVAVRDAGKIEPDGTTIYRWLAADHIDEGDVHVRRWSDTNDPLFPPTFRFTFKAGSVLLHSRNPRKVVIPRFDGITGEKLFVLKARDNQVLREDFLAFVLMSSRFSEWVSQWMSGSVNKFLNWSAFERFEFDLPPLDQQRRIAEILWVVDEVRQAWIEAVAATTRSRDALVTDLFKQPHPKVVCGEVLTLASGKAKPKGIRDATSPSATVPVYGGNGIIGYTETPLLSFPTLSIGRVGEYCGCVHFVEGASWITDNSIYVKEYSESVELRYLYWVLRAAN